MPPVHALFCRWGGATWEYMENLRERPQIWTGWLQKGCFSQTSTQPTRCARRVSWGWPTGTGSGTNTRAPPGFLPSRAPGGLQVAVAALALSRRGLSTLGQLGSVLSQAAKGTEHVGFGGRSCCQWHVLSSFPRVEWLGVVRDKRPLLPGQPPVLGRFPSPRKGRKAGVGGVLCPARSPLGWHSGAANGRRSVASWPWTLMTFLFPRCSTGSSAHWTPAHPQRLLHHQRARQKRYAVLQAAPAAQGTRARVGGMSATILMRDLASAGQLCERQLLAWAQRLCVEVARPSEQAAVRNARRQWRGNGLSAGPPGDLVESPGSFPATALPRTVWADTAYGSFPAAVLCPGQPSTCGSEQEVCQASRALG